MNVWIIGDLHQSVNSVENFYVNYLKGSAQEHEENWLICLGDFGGFHYFDMRDYIFKERMSKYPINFFVIRGNHEARAGDTAAYDNYIGWEEVDCFGGKCLREVSYPNIYYAEDKGGIYNIAGRKCLIIPGAYSVDKWYRIARGAPWFASEQMTEFEMNELTNLAQGQHFDFVFSHTCPKKYQPTDLFLACVDQNSVDCRMEEWMDRLQEEITYGVWCFGHYHQDRVEAPYVEMFFREVESFESIENRWMKYDETGELDWWVPVSPSMQPVRRIKEDI